MYLLLNLFQTWNHSTAVYLPQYVHNAIFSVNINENKERLLYDGEENKLL